MRKRLKSVDPAICGKVLAVLYGLFGTIAGVIVLLVSLFSEHSAVGIGTAIAMPFGYAIGGFLGGYIGSMIYNFVAELTGGLKFDLDDVVSLTPGRGPID